MVAGHVHVEISGTGRLVVDSAEVVNFLGFDLAACIGQGDASLGFRFCWEVWN